MSDIFGTNGEPEQEGALMPEGQGEADPTSEPPASTVDDFVNEETPVDLGVDPQAFVTLRTSSGTSHYVAVAGPSTLADIKLHSGLTFTTGTQFFLNGTVIEDAAVVPAGATLVAVGSVKGG